MSVIEALTQVVARGIAGVAGLVILAVAAIFALTSLVLGIGLADDLGFSRNWIWGFAALVTWRTLRATWGLRRRGR